MTDGEATAEQHHQASPPTTPPLRIHHLMIMMAVAMPLLMLSNVRWTQQEYGSQYVAASIVWVVAVAVSMVVLGLRWSWRSSGHSWLRDPGDALAVYEVLNWILVLPTMLLWRFWISANGANYYERPTGVRLWFEYGEYVTGLIEIVALVVLALYAARVWSWWIGFAMIPICWGLKKIALSLALWLIPPNELGAFFESSLSQLLWSVPYFPCVFAIAFACIRDRIAGRSRSWTHWCGVLGVVLGPIVAAANAVLFWLFG